MPHPRTSGSELSWLFALSSPTVVQNTSYVNNALCRILIYRPHTLGSELNWLFALTSSPTIVQNTSYVDNAIDGDLLKLVHLSNSFRMVEDTKPLQVGDVCRPEARIVSVTNSSHRIFPLSWSFRRLRKHLRHY